MGKLTVVLRSRNLYAEISSSATAAWRCHCFGRTENDSKMWIDTEVIDMSNSHATVTFEDREKVLAAPETPQWKIDNPCGAIWVDYSKSADVQNRIQITVNLPGDVYQKVRETDLRQDDIIVAVSFDNLTPRGEGSANAFLSTALVHFYTRLGNEE
jgi:hypothetical protein